MVRASWCVLWPPEGVFVVGVIHPWGIGIPCRFVSRSRPTTIFRTRGPQSVSHHHDSEGRSNPLPHPILSNFFGNIYIFSNFFFESCWWLWFSLRSRWQQIDKRRGRAHPQCWERVWQPNLNGLPRPPQVATIGRQKLRDGFGSSQLAFGTKLMFSSGNNPMTFLIDGALESRKVPVYTSLFVSVIICCLVLRSFLSCVCFFSLVFFWPIRTRWKTNLIFFWIFFFLWRVGESISGWMNSCC